MRLSTLCGLHRDTEQIAWFQGFQINLQVFLIKNCKCRVILSNFMFFQTVTTKQSLKISTKIVAAVSPAVHYDLWKDSSPRKVYFSASIKCLRIRAQTSFQSSALYLWALGQICFVKMSSSTLCCTVLLSNVLGTGQEEQDRQKKDRQNWTCRTGLARKDWGVIPAQSPNS